MIKSNALLICHVDNIEFPEDLGNGIDIGKNIKLTNNRQTISNLLNDDFQLTIGKLESNSLSNSKAVFYSIEKIEISEENHDEILCDFLAYCKLFLTELWLIKDHCADIMIGFVNYPFLQVNSSIKLPTIPKTTHSNILTGGFTDSQGNAHKKVIFSKKDLEMISLSDDFKNKVIVPFSESSKKYTLLEKGTPRLTLANLFLQMARYQHDLGVKISLYGTAFETLFSTDNTELSHKLSERIASFLGTNSESKIKLFAEVKSIYSIRSTVVHGSPLNKTPQEIAKWSERADNILRLCLTKINSKKELDKFYRRIDHKKEDFEDYLIALVFE